MDLLSHTQKALFNREEALLKEALAQVDSIKLLLQLAHDLKALSHHEFGQMTDTQMQIGRMLKGLLAYRRKKSGLPMQETEDDSAAR